MTAPILSLYGLQAGEVMDYTIGSWDFGLKDGVAEGINSLGLTDAMAAFWFLRCTALFLKSLLRV